MRRPVMQVARHTIDVMKSLHAMSLHGGAMGDRCVGATECKRTKIVWWRHTRLLRKQRETSSSAAPLAPGQVQKTCAFDLRTSEIPRVFGTVRSVN